MRRFLILVLLASATTACGAGSTATTVIQAIGGDLSGVRFEVHETPG
jgi:hypothetical protein